MSIGSAAKIHNPDTFGNREREREKPVSAKIYRFLPFPEKVCGFLRFFSAKICHWKLLRTIVKPLWPTTPKTQKKAKMTQDRKIVALKLPKISLSKGYFGQFKGYILCSGNLRGFFASEGGSCHRGFTIVLFFLRRSAIGNCEWGGFGKGAFSNSWLDAFSLQGHPLLQGNSCQKLAHFALQKPWPSTE